VRKRLSRKHETKKETRNKKVRVTKMGIGRQMATADIDAILSEA
jgi:hypothetical protein